jgi:bacteriorhodopsin
MNKTLYDSFYITYAFLVTTGTITFIEALRTNIVAMRHILNLETCISIVAAFFYGNFIQKINKEKDKKDNKDNNDNMTNTLQNEINDTRYVDWMITTPIMLLVLILAFQYNSGKKGVRFIDYMLILFLNYGMLGSGYLGEKHMISKLNANIVGFVFFALLFGYMYCTYLMKGGNSIANQQLYAIFFVLWAFYGMFYLTKENIKNAGYNVLDLFSKCFVGIYFWSYSSSIFS